MYFLLVFPLSVLFPLWHNEPIKHLLLIPNDYPLSKHLIICELYQSALLFVGFPLTDL